MWVSELPTDLVAWYIGDSVLQIVGKGYLVVSWLLGGCGLLHE